MRRTIRQLIEDIHPLDSLEATHQQQALLWVDSGAPIFRTAKPDVPKMHLVCYGAPIDKDKRLIMLCDHRKAELWLPPGGHVEPDEDPSETVRREIQEELGIIPEFMFTTPFFITITDTTGPTAGHTDVSLWYALDYDSRHAIQFDTGEFHGIRWWNFESAPLDKSDPHLSRFLKKLALLTAV